MEQLCTILEGKADIGLFEDMQRQNHNVNNKVDRVEFNRVADLVTQKANREDVDQLFETLQQSKNDQEKRILSLEKEVDSSVGELQREMEDVKQHVISSLNKKADFTLLERLRETTLKKVDMEYVQNQLLKYKQDMNTQIELAVNELKYQRRVNEYVTLEEQSKKAMQTSERAIDEMTFFKE